MLRSSLTHVASLIGIQKPLSFQEVTPSKALFHGLPVATNTDVVYKSKIKEIINRFYIGG